MEKVEYSSEPRSCSRYSDTLLGAQRVCGVDFGGGAPSALDRAVHIPLPLGARVLAGEKQSSAWPREPRPELRVEERIEIRIATARPRVGFPDDLTRANQLGAFR